MSGDKKPRTRLGDDDDNEGKDRGECSAGPSSSQSGRVDIRSEDFDPMAALYADDYDKCEGLVFQSVSQCESFFSRKDKREKKVNEDEVRSFMMDRDVFFINNDT